MLTSLWAEMADGEKKTAVLDAKAFGRHLEVLRGQWEVISSNYIQFPASNVTVGLKGP